MGDFSVVLFRADCVLVSEQNHMKALKNQRLLNLLCPPDISCGGTNQGTYSDAQGADACAVICYETTP
jgi:hypothetical protein